MVSGPSGSGKTTLIEKLIPELIRRGFRVAAAKHDPHGHATGDVEGKDSWRFAQAGAEIVDILGPGHRASFAVRSRTSNDTPELSAEAYQCDFVLVEGFKTGALPRLEIVPDGGEPVLASGTVAMIGGQISAGRLPVFGRDDIPSIGDFIVSRLSARRPACVVLAGGPSRRMGRDKATIALSSGETMLGRAIAACLATGARTLVMSRHDDHESIADGAGVEFLIDEGPRHPAQGIVAALQRLDHEAGVVAVPCDSPGLRSEVLSRLADAAAEPIDFACFSIDGRLRPLPGYFSSRAMPALQIIAREGLPLYQLAAQVGTRLLSEYEARLLDEDLSSFTSINTIEDLRKADPAAPVIQVSRQPQKY